MIENSSPANHHAEVSSRRALAAVLAPLVMAPVIVALLLAAFAWPAARLGPRNLPIGVAGSAADALVRRLGTGLAGSAHAVEVHRYADEAAARTAIEEREIYGAIIAGPDGVTVLTASAASPAVAYLLPQAVATAMAATAGTRGGAAAAIGEAAPDATEDGLAAGGTAGTAGGGTAASGVAGPAAGAAVANGATAGPAAPGVLVPRVVDVVPAPAGDPRGVALAAIAFPLVLAGMIVSGMVTSTTRPGVRQVCLLVAASAAVGLAATGVVQGWLGILGGYGWVNAGALASLVLAVAAAVAGLRALLGIGGFVFGAVLFVFVGNPWSGFTSAPELLPRSVGSIGELLPPGAGGSLIRSVAFFDGHGSGGHVLVLAVWAAVGMVGVCAADLRAARRSAAAPDGAFDDAFDDTPDGQPDPAAFGMEPVTLTQPAARASGTSGYGGSGGLIGDDPPVRLFGRPWA